MLGTCKDGGAEGKIDLSWTVIARSPFHLSLRVAGADPFTVYLTSELCRRWDLLWKIFLKVRTLTSDTLYQVQLVADQEKGMKINLGWCLFTSLCAEGLQQAPAQEKHNSGSQGWIFWRITFTLKGTQACLLIMWGRWDPGDGHTSVPSNL